MHGSWNSISAKSQIPCSVVTKLQHLAHLRLRFIPQHSMEIQEALEIIRRLADGLHPENGDALADDCLYQNPKAVRALHCAVRALELQQAREHARKSLPPNAGKPWSEHEDRQLHEELRRGMSLQEIAKTHSRRVGSVVARLVRLRKSSADAPLPRTA
jgi:hypothetical protein